MYLVLQALPQRPLARTLPFGFAANYLGTTEGLFDCISTTQSGAEKATNPLSQLRVGEMRIELDAAQALFRARDHRVEPGGHRGGRTHLHECQGHHAPVSPSRCRTPSFTERRQRPIRRASDERFIRDIETHVIHAGRDRTAQIVGQAALGQAFDSTLQR